MTPLINEISATEAKQCFGELLGTCLYGGGKVVITKHNKPVAVLVSMDEWKAREKSPTQAGSLRQELAEPDFVRRARELRRRILASMSEDARRKPISAAQLVRNIRDGKYDE